MIETPHGVNFFFSYLPVVQHSDGGAMHQAMGCGPQLEPLLVGLPPSAPTASGHVVPWQLSHLGHGEPLLLSLLGVMLPASKTLSKHPV